MGKSKFKVGDKVRCKGQTTNKIYTIGYVKYDIGDKRNIYILKELPSTCFAYSYQLEKVDTFIPKSNTSNSSVTLEFDKTALNTIDYTNKFKNCANKIKVDGIVIKNRYGDVDENTRAVKLTLEEAQEMYNTGGKLRELALRVFTEDELKPVPYTWEEYCENAYGKFYYIKYGKIQKYTLASDNIGGLDKVVAGDMLPSKEMADAVLAFKKLLILRNAWIKNWTPDWSDEKQEKYYLKWCFKNVSVFPHRYTDSANEVMSFPTIEMARKFKDCFGDFLETAKNLY